MNYARDLNALGDLIFNASNTSGGNFGSNKIGVFSEFADVNSSESPSPNFLHPTVKRDLSSENLILLSATGVRPNRRIDLIRLLQGLDLIGLLNGVPHQ